MISPIVYCSKRSATRAPAGRDRIRVARRQIARGLGLVVVPRDRAGIEASAVSLLSIPALSYDLTFPEVFYPLGVPSGRQGFHAVLGNPPWDRMLPANKEFFAGFEFSVMAANTKRERSAIEQGLLQQSPIRLSRELYVQSFRQNERSAATNFEWQIAMVDGRKTIGKQDIYRLFLERNHQLLRYEGITGVVVPAAFHGAGGATGVRRLYFEQMHVLCCYSFQNKRKIFDIVTNVKFALVVAKKSSTGTKEFDCAFYLHSDEWLFQDHRDGRLMRYSLDFVRETGGAYLCLVELSSKLDLETAKTCFANGKPFGSMCKQQNIGIGRELNMTDDAWRFTATEEILGERDARDPENLEKIVRDGYLVVSEDDSIHIYTDHWTDRPQYLVHVSRLAGKESWQRSTRYFRLFYRRIATVVDARSFMVAMVPPGWLSASPQANRSAGTAPTHVDLVFLSLLASYTTDWNLRLRITATVNLFISESVPLPVNLGKSKLFLAHSALRLSCNHAGYAPLWREQLGDEWQEVGKAPRTWPVLDGNSERWQVRAAIDAVVADAYGLSRDQYCHVLSTFTHASYPKAPDLCLAMFDELRATGSDAFTKKHDPYWDIPVNENLPEPVINLPGYRPAGDDAFSLDTTSRPKGSRGRRRS